MADRRSVVPQLFAGSTLRRLHVAIGGSSVEGADLLKLSPKTLAASLPPMSGDNLSMLIPQSLTTAAQGVNAAVENFNANTVEDKKGALTAEVQRTYEAWMKAYAEFSPQIFDSINGKFAAAMDKQSTGEIDGYFRLLQRIKPIFLLTDAYKSCERLFRRREEEKKSTVDEIILEGYEVLVGLTKYAFPRGLQTEIKYDGNILLYNKEAVETYQRNAAAAKKIVALKARIAELKKDEDAKKVGKNQQPSSGTPAMGLASSRVHE